MRFGLCIDLGSIAAAEKAGFDYVEPPVANLLPDKPDQDFAPVAQAAKDSSLKPEAFNCFIPGSMKITGPEANLNALRQYVGVAAARAAALGGKVIVFGSGGARSVPDGFPADKAMAQVDAFLNAIAPIAEEAGIIIVIEPLRKAECNIINFVKEGLALARKANKPSIRALADLYHVGQGNEPYENTAAAGPMLAHVHIAHPVHRKCPMPGDGFDYKPFFRALKQAKYDTRISLECGWDNLAVQGPVSLAYQRAEWVNA